MRTRKQLYVAADIHKKVMRAAFLFKDNHTTAVSLVDAILREHFSANRDVFIEKEERLDDEFTQTLDRITSND